MNNEKQMLNKLKIDALFAYLELCNELEEVPRKEVYNSLKESNAIEKLEKVTQLIEKQHSEYLKNK